MLVSAVDEFVKILKTSVLVRYQLIDMSAYDPPRFHAEVWYCGNQRIGGPRVFLQAKTSHLMVGHRLHASDHVELNLFVGGDGEYYKHLNILLDSWRNNSENRDRQSLGNEFWLNPKPFVGTLIGDYKAPRWVDADFPLFGFYHGLLLERLRNARTSLTSRDEYVKKEALDGLLFRFKPFVTQEWLSLKRRTLGW